MLMVSPCDYVTLDFETAAQKKKEINNDDIVRQMKSD